MKKFWNEDWLTYIFASVFTMFIIMFFVMVCATLIIALLRLSMWLLSIPMPW